MPTVHLIQDSVLLTLPSDDDIDQQRGRTVPVEVDDATAERWARVMAEAEQVHDEMAIAYVRARP